MVCLYQRLEKTFHTQIGANHAVYILQKSISSIGETNVKIYIKKNDPNTICINLKDENPSKQKASYFGAKRLLDMLVQIDNTIK